MTNEEGAKLGQDIRAACYLECSALKLRGVVRVFHEAIYAGTKSQQKQNAPPKNKKCRILWN